MYKIAIFLLLAMGCSESAFAVVYQCRDKAGNTFLTNDRSKFPPGCEQYGEVYGEQPPPPPATNRPAGQRNPPEMNGRGPAAAPSPAQAPRVPRQAVEPAAPAAPPAGPESPAEEEE